MASPGREYSPDHHLIEHMKFSGIERENLNDLITIVVSLKNKYRIVPLAAAAQGNGIYHLEQNHQHLDWTSRASTPSPSCLWASQNPPNST
jgi:hypothetical protein